MQRTLGLYFIVDLKWSESSPTALKNLGAESEK